MRIVNVRDFIRAGFCVCLLACLIPAPPSHAGSNPGRWGWCRSARARAPSAAQAQSPTTDSKTVKLADNVYMFLASYGNTLIVTGRNGVLITDTYDDAHARLLKEAIAKITNEPVTKIVLSHEHFDHIGGTRQFAGAQIIAQKNILPFLVFDPLHRAPQKIDTTFDTDFTIDMGTTKVQLKYWGMTEGVANIVVYLPKEKIALLSDLYLGPKTLVDFLSLSDTNMLGLRHVLNEVSKWDLKYVLDSHTPNTDAKVLREYAGFMNDLYDAVYPLVERENATVDSSRLWEDTQFKFADSIKLPKYEDWNGYEEELPANVLWMASSILYGGL